MNEREMNWPPEWPYPPDSEPVAAGEAMVVTTDRLASEAGLAILRDGGNAVDAAIATSFALAVVNPEAGNLGGGGYLVVRTADGDLHALDCRSQAPGAASRDLFLDADGEVGERARIGHLAVAVPGSVRGLWEAHRRLGSARWADLVDPAVALARGFVAEERFLRSFVPEIVEGLGRFPATAEIFLPDGAPPELGRTFRQPDLARTLELVRDRGAEGFYRGPTAEKIVAEMERGGGILTHEDLATYTAAWRRPLRFRYRGHRVVSMPPSSSGGIVLGGTARILEAMVGRLAADGGVAGDGVAGGGAWTGGIGALPWHGPRHVHLLVEAWRRAYADRNRLLADPDFTENPRKTLTSAAYGRWRARDLSFERATPSTEVAPGVEAFRAEDGCTTHLSVVGPAGDAVSHTTTLNTWYGSKVVVPGTGVLLNNEMDDFTAKAGVPNYFGLVQGEANAIEPAKRPLSAMSPTLVLDGDDRLRMVVGTPGGSSIITTVFQVVSNVLDHGMGLAPAVLAPRVHHQHLPDRITYEPGGLPEGVVESLREMGHAVEERERFSGDVQAVLVRSDGTLEGQSDPRRGGVAAGF